MEKQSDAEADLRTILDRIATMVWVIQHDGQHEYQNSAWPEYTGLTREQLAASNWTVTIHPEDLPRLREMWQATRDAGTSGMAEVRIRRYDGVYRWFSMRAEPHRDPSGQIVRWYGTTTDIDDSKQAQTALAELQARMTHVARVTTLGEMTASIAHEVNQPLTAIIANVGAGRRWLAQGPAGVESALESLDLIARDAKRMKEVITRLRSLFSKGVHEHAPIDVNETAAEMLAFTQAEATRHDVIVRTQLSDTLPKVPADRIQIQQVMLNLISNAIQSMSTVDRSREMRVVTREDESQVFFGVEDAGGGIDATDTERLFEAFYTTKATGMGLGLATSRTIVQAHGGRIWAEPNEPVGARFYFTLPIAPAS